MFDKKLGSNYCAEFQRRVAPILLAVVAAMPASALANDIASQILVQRSAIYTAAGSAKPRPQLSKLMHDGQQSNGWQLWELPEGENPAEVARQLNELYSNGTGAIAELNQPRLPQLFAKQSLKATGLSSPNRAALEQLQLAEAWKTTTGKASVVVAIIDDGIDFQHPGLREKIWRNDEEVANDGVDNDRNGFVDDINGWNFHESNNFPGHQPRDSGHGTLVAGAIAGDYVNDNGETVAIGSAPGVSIMPLRISHDSHSLLRALTYAANNNADIINISLGGILPSIAEEQAIATLRDRGILVVAAAGNHHNNNDFRGIYPASYPLANILSVAAQSTTTTITDWSQYGSSSVDIAAPGVDLISTERGGTYTEISGTSMATGYTSGVAALIKSQFPSDDYRGIKARLFVSAKTIEPPFVTRSDAAVNAAGALTAPPQATFMIRQLSSASAGNQLDISIEIEPFYIGAHAPQLVDTVLLCTTSPDNNSVSTQFVGQNNYSINYRVATTSNRHAADIRCELSLTDDQATTSRRRFRLTAPGQLELSTAVQATLQTDAQHDYDHWVVDIPAGRDSLELFVRSEQNIDVLLRPAEAPRYVASLGTSAPALPFLLTDNDTTHSASSSGFERLRRSQPAAGEWHIVVLNQQQLPDTHYSIEVTAQGTAGEPLAATPAGRELSMDVASRSSLGNESGGGAMYWLAILAVISLKRRASSTKPVNT